MGDTPDGTPKPPPSGIDLPMDIKTGTTRVPTRYIIYAVGVVLAGGFGTSWMSGFAPGVDTGKGSEILRQIEDLKDHAAEPHVEISEIRALHTAIEKVSESVEAIRSHASKPHVDPADVKAMGDEQIRSGVELSHIAEDVKEIAEALNKKGG